MKFIILIGAGSFAGGILRYLLSQAVQAKALSAFPYGTLAVNITGCLLIGAVFALSERGNVNQEWRVFLATGFLGGFTTFSAFSNETVGMLREGMPWHAVGYVAVSVLLGALATMAGYALAKMPWL